MRDLPGFFYDEAKGKYFPIHLKEAYEKQKKALEKEEEKRLVEESKKTSDLYKFIGNSPLKFDSVLEKISRIKVTEIIWPNKLLQIDPDNDIYYRYNGVNGYHCIQHIKISTGEEVDSFISEYESPLLKFGVLHVDARSKCYHYLIFEKQADTGIKLNLFTPRDIIYSGHSYQSLVNYEAISCNNRIYFYIIDTNTFSKLELRYIEGGCLSKLCQILPKNFDFFAAFPETGLIRVCKGGLITVKAVDFKLCSSSAKWLHYYEGKLLILTHHGHFVKLTLNTKEQVVIFDIKDLDLPECRFENLIIDAKGKVVVVGYKNKTDIIFLNWMDVKVIKKLSYSKLIEQFRISSDLFNLYIHTLQ